MLNIFEKIIANCYEPDHLIENWRTGEVIVIWKDGTKTTVRPIEGTPRSIYSAFTAALAKKIFGSNSQVNKIVSKYEVPEKRNELKRKKRNEKRIKYIMDRAVTSFEEGKRT